MGIFSSVKFHTLFYCNICTSKTFVKHHIDSANHKHTSAYNAQVMPLQENRQKLLGFHGWQYIEY